MVPCLSRGVTASMVQGFTLGATVFKPDVAIFLGPLSHVKKQSPSLGANLAAVLDDSVMGRLQLKQSGLHCGFCRHGALSSSGKLVKRLEHVPKTLIKRHSFRLSWSLGKHARRGFRFPIPESLGVLSSVAGLVGVGVLFRPLLSPDVALVTV